MWLYAHIKLKLREHIFLTLYSMKTRYQENSVYLPRPCGRPVKLIVQDITRRYALKLVNLLLDHLVDWHVGPLFKRLYGRRICEHTGWREMLFSSR
jgi:hypothetical protein